MVSERGAHLKDACLIKYTDTMCFTGPAAAGSACTVSFSASPSVGALTLQHWRDSVLFLFWHVIAVTSVISLCSTDGIPTYGAPPRATLRASWRWRWRHRALTDEHYLRPPLWGFPTFCARAVPRSQPGMMSRHALPVYVHLARSPVSNDR